MGEPTRNYSNSNNKQTNKYWNIKEISEAERYIEYKFVERRFASVAVNIIGKYTTQTKHIVQG